MITEGLGGGGGLTWHTEVMFTLIMLVMNWKQAKRKSEPSRCH